jgi:hypothetical protein
MSTKFMLDKGSHLLGRAMEKLEAGHLNQIFLHTGIIFKE